MHIISANDPEGLRVLCLDAGDSRCMSQLYILEEFMHRLEYKLGRKVLPCDYFHLITGVDSSSLLAGFLGLFRMSVTEAQKAFHDVYLAVFNNEKSSPAARGKILDEELKKLMESQKIPTDIRLSDSLFTDGCKVALCYSPASRMDHCGFFRNYQSPQHVTHDVTVLEALHASWATPGFIQSVTVGIDGQAGQIASAVVGFGNPIQEVIKEAYQLFGAKARVACLLSLGSGYRGVVSLDNEANPTSSLASRLTIDVETVAEEVYRRFARLGVYYRLSVDHGLEGWNRLEAGFGAMRGHVDAYLAKKEASSKLDRCISASVATGAVLMDQLYGSKYQGLRSSHGLPPLSAYFVTRKVPMQAMVKGLIERDGSSQRIMVISGLGGSGKTQLALKFARDFQDSYQHILFIDASSSEGIQKTLIARVRSMKPDNIPTTVEEAIDALSNPDDHVTKDWLIIFDNVDSLEEPLSNYIPPCDHGSILVTTRDPSLGELAPEFHLELGSMSEAEAVEVLLSAAFPVGKISPQDSQSQSEEISSGPTPRDREAAIAIARELGYLPIAVVQAGCYIKQHKVLHQYLRQLRTNRSELLKRATRVHLDRLKYPHSVYASFDIVLQALSPRTVQLLGILSFFHFSNFPRPLFALAAESHFAYQLYDLLARTEEFDNSISFLTEVLCPGGDWIEDDLNQLFEELQRYSLVTFVSTGPVVSLRFHPLVHGWSRDRMSPEDYDKHQAAAVRLLVAGIKEGDDQGLFDHLSSHALSLSKILDTLHVNDRAAISWILNRDSNPGRHLDIWKTIYQQVEAVHGKKHVRATRAALDLADAYGESGDAERMEEMEREALVINEEILGKDALETVGARSNLARTLRGKGRYRAAETMEEEVLRARIRILGFTSRMTAAGMEDLAATWNRLGRHKDRKGVLLGAVAINTRVLGRAARRTIQSLDTLSGCHYTLGEHEEAEKIHKEVLELRQSLHGEENLNTVASMVWLAERYQEQGRYKEAKALRKSEVTVRKALQGNNHPSTLEALSALAKATFELAQYAEAQETYDELLESYRIVDANFTSRKLITTYWAGRTRFEQDKYGDAEKVWKEWLEGCKITYAPLHKETLNARHWLARVALAQERVQEAADSWTTIVADRRKAQGKNNVQTLHALGWLAKAQFQLKKWKEVEALRKEEMEGRRKTQSPSHSDTLNAMHWLARAYLEQGEKEKATELFREHLAITQPTLGARHAKTLDSISWVARGLFDEGKYKESAELRQQRVDVMKEVSGARHPDVLKAMYNVGKSWHENKSHKEAEAVWREWLEACRAEYSEDNVSVLDAKYWLGKELFSQKRDKEAEQLWEEELAVRRKLKQPMLSGRVLYQLARAHKRAGRISQAKEIAEEALEERLKVYKADHERVKETTKLIDSLPKNTNIQAEAEDPPPTAAQVPVPTSPQTTPPPIEVISDGGNSSEETLVPDPGGDPTFLPPSTSDSPNLSFARPRSPFDVRSIFGARPNSWSML